MNSRVPIANDPDSWGRPNTSTLPRPEENDATASIGKNINDIVHDKAALERCILALGSALVWNNTDEGQDYWSTVCIKLQRYHRRARRVP